MKSHNAKQDVGFIAALSPHLPSSAILQCGLNGRPASGSASCGRLPQGSRQATNATYQAIPKQHRHISYQTQLKFRDHEFRQISNLLLLLCTNMNSTIGHRWTSCDDEKTSLVEICPWRSNTTSFYISVCKEIT